MKRATKLIYTSTWKKEDKRCHITSEKQIRQQGIDPAINPIGTFTFAGHNPFPCYSMKSTYGVITRWMRENGWTRIKPQKMKVVYDVIDDETGEIIADTTREVIWT